jgi:hypothetical protein
MYVNFPRYLCKKVQTIVKTVALLMGMVMVVTHCTLSFYMIMAITHCIILTETPYCIMVMVAVYSVLEFLEYFQQKNSDVMPMYAYCLAAA